MLEISMHRGDYTKKTLNIKDSSGNAIEFDEIYFTVKKTTKKTDYLFQKTLSNGNITSNDDGTYTIEINPEDTDELSFGAYVFDIQVSKSDPTIKQTFLGELYILEEVTYATNEIETTSDETTDDTSEDTTDIDTDDEGSE